MCVRECKKFQSHRSWFTSLTCVTFCLGFAIQDRLFYRVSPKTFSFRFIEEKKKKLLINDMTFHLCASHSIFSLGYRRILVPERSDILGNPKASTRVLGKSGRWGSIEDAGWRPNSQSLAAAQHPVTTSSRPDAAGTVGSGPEGMVVMCPVHSVPPHGCWDKVAGLGPKSIWSLTAVAITPLGFSYCLELMNYWLANYLLHCYFSKGFINGSRCVAATIQGHYRGPWWWEWTSFSYFFLFSSHPPFHLSGTSYPSLLPFYPLYLHTFTERYVTDFTYLQ